MTMKYYCSDFIKSAWNIIHVYEIVSSHIENSLFFLVKIIFSKLSNDKFLWKNFSKWKNKANFFREIVSTN